MKWPWQRKKKPRRIGLALSGGAVRGMAHLGVLEVLEREGIRPSCVAGASAGSIVGAAYCAGIPLADIKRLALRLQWSDVSHIVRPGLGFFDSQPLEDYVDEVIAGRRFDELPIPFSAVAVDVMSGELVVLDEGPVAHAVRASCALPVVFTPVSRGDQVLVDGGVLNNVPVSVVRDMGADYVIAVDLVPPFERPEPPHSVFELGTLVFSTLLRSAYDEAQTADCLIVPDISRFSWADFSQALSLIAEGRKAAEAKIGQIKRDLE
ncbi:MAG: patatin-like phospholipase family protein [Chloroflexota bacterium]|nr:patatin-like phospholipase family protein [Chloroflexota bacterium]